MQGANGSAAEQECFLGPDLELLARAYRVGYARPSSLSEFGRAVVDGFSGNLPTVIHLTPAISAS